MLDEKLKNLLKEDKTEEVEETLVDSLPSTNLNKLAEDVMASYQNANRWLDSIKEYVLMEQGCVFFSNYIHNLAHTMPARFDKFGDILHTVDMTIPYPATSAIETMPSDIPSTFQQVLDIIGAISLSLRNFIKITQDTELHAMACSAEGLLEDIENERTTLYRLRRAYVICGADNIKFDKWVGSYLNNADKILG